MPPPEGLAKSQATAQALDKLAISTQKAHGVVKHHTIFSNPQPDQSLPEANETMSRVSYYQAPQVQPSKPSTKEQPAHSVKGDLSAPVAFVRAAVEAATDAANVAAHTDAVYKDVLSGPLQYMSSEHFRLATAEERQSHGIPESVSGEWRMLEDPKLGIPINNRCKKALQSYLVSQSLNKF